MASLTQNIRKAGLIPFFALASFLLPFPLLAQNTYSVTTAAGDASAGSLGAAVTGLNASGLAGAITFTESSPITLSQPLAPVSQSVTLQGSGIAINGSDESEAQFYFQQSVNQQNSYLTLQNINFSTGLDLSVTSAGWSMAPNSNLYLYGAGAPSTLASSGTSIIGQAGGNLQFTTGDWTAGGICQFGAGVGGLLADNNGTGDQGGAGGSVSLGFTDLAFTGDTFEITAGAGGNIIDSNGTGDVGGNGGSVMVQGNNFLFAGGNPGELAAGNGGSVSDTGTVTSLGGMGGSVDLSLTGGLTVTFGNFLLNAGNGGAGVTGGAGGGATLTAGSVTLSTILSVQAGNGGQGISLSGAGGSAYVSIGSINQSSEYLEVFGGAGGPSNFSTGAGGNVQLLGEAVTLSGTAGMEAIGGAGGNSYESGAGGNGGDAGVSLATLSLTGSIVNFKVSGGTGGLGSQGASTGNGGNGGNLAVTLGTLDLNAGSALTLTGGVGGAGGDGNAGVNGGNGGAGGSVSFSAGQVSMASGTTFLLSGDSGGAGGTGDVSGTAGAAGSAFGSITILNGQGALSMTGSSSLLEISSGSFSGDISGDETLQKTGAGALTLSGSNSYSGGTTISDGTLAVDTGGTLGTGAVVNNYYLNYLDSATAGSATITNNSGSVLQFNNSSTAGNAVITSIGDGGVYFYGNSSGGTAQFIFVQNIGVNGILDISEASVPVTVGSVSGLGYFFLGSNNLAVGANNLSTTFTGPIVDGGLAGGSGGSLTKIGSGTLTLFAGAVTSTYSGGTNIDAGTLAVGSAQALGLGSVSVNGGTLESAGAPIGLVIGGNYSQGSGGTLKLGLASFSSYDTVSVGINASLGGTLNLYSYSGLTPPVLGSSVVVLSPAGTLTGTFQQVDENLGDTRLLPLYYNNAVELESIVPSFLAISSTPNQKAIGADLDSTVFNPKLMGMMSQLGPMSASSLQTAENQVSPEGLSALFQAGFEGAASRAVLVDQRLSQLRDSQPPPLPGYSQSATPLFAGLQPVEQEAAMGLPQREGDWSGFAFGNGGVFNVAGNTNAAGYQMTTYGLTGAGADLRLSPDFALGLMAGFGQSNITLDGGGTLTVGGGQLGLYGLFASQGFYADGLVEGGISQYNTLRQSYVGVASGQTPGSEWSGAMELGYGWKVKPMTVGPVASLQYTRVGFNGFSETGSVSPLTYPRQSQDSFMSRLGVQADGHWNLGGVVLSPQLTLAWEHEYDNLGGNVVAGFGAGDSFTVAGPTLGQNGFLVGAGADLALSKNISVALNYQGELGRANFNSNQFGGGLRLGF